MMSLGYLQWLFFHKCCRLPLVGAVAPFRRYWLALLLVHFPLPPADPPPVVPDRHPTVPIPAHGGGPRLPANHRRHHRHCSSIEGAVGPSYSCHRQHCYRHVWCWATIVWTFADRRILAFPVDWYRNPSRRKSCWVWPWLCLWLWPTKRRHCYCYWYPRAVPHGLVPIGSDPSHHYSVPSESALAGRISTACCCCQ